MSVYVLTRASCISEYPKKGTFILLYLKVQWKEDDGAVLSPQ